MAARIEPDTILAVFGHDGQICRRTQVVWVQRFPKRTKVTDSSGAEWDLGRGTLFPWNGNTWSVSFARVWTPEDEEPWQRQKALRVIANADMKAFDTGTLTAIARLLQQAAKRDEP